MLQAPSHDSRSYAKAIGKSADGRHTEIIERTEVFVFGRWNEEIAGEGIGFCLARVAGGGFWIAVFDEHGSFAMLQDMGRFVEEGEPEVIIGLASQAELDQCLRGMEPAGGTIGPDTVQWWDND